MASVIGPGPIDRDAHTSGTDAHIFVSYSGRDADIVRLIEDGLRQRKLPVWLDYSELQAGDHVPALIERKISDALFYVIFLSPRSVMSDWVTKELNIARRIQEARSGRFIIPVLLEDCAVPDICARYSLWIVGIGLLWRL